MVCMGRARQIPIIALTEIKTPKQPMYKWTILALRTGTKLGGNEMRVFLYATSAYGRFDPEKIRLIYVKKVALSLSDHN
jgi:hypothetical protein